jgi:transcriptional antiterminator RfaH
MKLRQCEATGLKGSSDRIRQAGFESVRRWYLVQCRARQEERALEHLERQGFECYRPLYDRERIRRGRKVLTQAALFPGYLFIRLDRIHDNWLPICSTRGVIQIVRFNAYPLPVADDIIERIRRRIASGPLREPYLKTGERVVITQGSFSGIEAIFVACDGDERVMLLLNILQSEQTLSFPIESVRKISHRRPATVPYAATAPPVQS